MAGNEDGSAVIGIGLDVSKELGRLKKRIEKNMQDIADLRYEIRALQADVNKAHNEEERYGRKLAEAKSLLSRQEEEAGELQKK